jgi:hypothetical protein
MKWPGSLSRERPNRAMKDMLAELRQSRDGSTAGRDSPALATDQREARREAPVYERLVAGLQSRGAELHCARSADPVIAHDFENATAARSAKALHAQSPPGVSFQGYA